ncbi:hypothetical protein C8T65DRAFT_748005 [Cerioporus squamosus]|nr:hypothetical protein C8T65DRAFT_748005 [Cerioporus squamosus]
MKSSESFSSKHCARTTASPYMQLVLNDVQDFLARKQWYTPYSIAIIASTLNLDVYGLSLTKIGMNDSTFTSIIAAELPNKCIMPQSMRVSSMLRNIVNPGKQNPDGPGN